MTEKRFTDIEHDYENARIRCKVNGMFMLYAIYENDDGLPTLGDLLNGQEELIKRLKQIREEQTETILKQKRKIKELEKEKQDLKDKAEILVDYYSRRYVNAIFNNGKHSKQFKSDLWTVKEVLCVLDLYGGDVE